MTQNQAKKHLGRMLRSLTPGSVLHLLGEVIREEGEAARRSGDKKLHRRCQVAEHALFVVGMGLDAALPQ
jgi:hypothetical protein